MSTLNAGQYGAASVYYGGSSAPFTRWPSNQGGDSNGVNSFLIGKSFYLVPGMPSLPQRSVSVYFNAGSASFAARLAGAGSMVPARIGPMAAFLDTAGPYGGVY